MSISEEITERAKAVRGRGMILGPTRLEHTIREDGTGTWTPYVRGAKGYPALLIQSASDDRRDAILAQIQVCAAVDEDFREVASEVFGAKSKDGALPFDAADELRNARAEAAEWKQRAERAEAAFREYVDAAEAHSNHGEWALITALAERDMVAQLLIREGDTRVRYLLAALNGEAQDPYVAELRALMLAAACDRKEDDVEVISERGRRRLSRAMSAWLEEVLPTLGKASK